MKVLEVNKRYLILYGVLSKDEENIKAIDQIRKFLTNFLLVAGSFFSLSICSATYIYHNSGDLSGVTNALLNLFTGLSACGAYTGLIFNERNINIFYHELHEIVNSEKWATKISASATYHNVEKQCIEMTKWTSNALFMIVGSYLSSLCVLPVFFIVRGNYNTSTWIFDQKMEIPFGVDPSTIFGWYLRTISYVFGSIAWTVIVSTIFPFLIGCNSYIVAFCKHFKMILDDFDEIMSSKWENEAKQRKAIFEKMNGAVSLHLKIIK